MVSVHNTNTLTLVPRHRLTLGLLRAFRHPHLDPPIGRRPPTVPRPPVSSTGDDLGHDSYGRLCDTLHDAVGDDSTDVVASADPGHVVDEQLRLFARDVAAGLDSPAPQSDTAIVMHSYDTVWTVHDLLADHVDTLPVWDRDGLPWLVATTAGRLWAQPRWHGLVESLPARELVEHYGPLQVPLSGHCPQPWRNPSTRSSDHGPRAHSEFSRLRHLGYTLLPWYRTEDGKLS